MGPMQALSLPERRFFLLKPINGKTKTCFAVTGSWVRPPHLISLADYMFLLRRPSRVIQGVFCIYRLLGSIPAPPGSAFIQRILPKESNHVLLRIPPQPTSLLAPPANPEPSAPIPARTAAPASRVSPPAPPLSFAARIQEHLSEVCAGAGLPDLATLAANVWAGLPELARLAADALAGSEDDLEHPGRCREAAQEAAVNFIREVKGRGRAGQDNGGTVAAAVGLLALLDPELESSAAQVC
jgi:hypothetical protein